MTTREPLPRRLILSLGATLAITTTAPIEAIASPQAKPTEQLAALRAAASEGALQLVSVEASGVLRHVDLEAQQEKWGTRDKARKEK